MTSIKKLVSLMLSTLFLLTCSTTWASDTQVGISPSEIRTLKPQSKKKTLQKEETLDPQAKGAYWVPKGEFNELLNYATRCRDFATECNTKVGLYEQRKAETDKLIQHQEQRNLLYKDQLEAERRQRHWLYPLLGIGVGFLGGALLIHK